MTTLPDGLDLSDRTDDELTEERDFLLRSLADLEEEHQAGDVDEDDYRVLRDGYTARAATVLRLLDRRRVEDELATPTEPARADPARAHRWRAPAVVLVVAAFAVAAGLLVAHSAGQRLPGDSVSGSTPNSKAQQLLVQAGDDVQKNNIVGALKLYQQVLSTDPRNAEALSSEGWLIALAGNTAHDQQLLDRGLASVRMAEQVDPSYATPHFFSGSILLQEGHAKDAITEFEQYLADDPSSPQAALVRQDLQTAQDEAAGRLPSGASVAPVPSTTVP